MNFFDRFQKGLSYQDFLARYANENQKQRWRAFHEQVKLTAQQHELLASFRRTTNVLCLAGAWCGDCIQQCPIFEHLAQAAPVIQVRYLDRDEHADVQRELQINGGNRVPVLVFFSEDGFEVARYGERTLSKYRLMMREQAGASCPSGIAIPGDVTSLLTQDWLSTIQRVQWLLRLSPRHSRFTGIRQANP